MRSEPPPTTVTSAERLALPRSLKRAASAPPEVERSSRRIKTKRLVDTTLFISISFIPPPRPIDVPIMTVRKLPGASHSADVLVYLGKDHIYKVDGQALKKSSWMYDRLPKHGSSSCSPFIKDENHSPPIESERVEGIIAFFELPTGAKSLEAVSRQRFLSLLPNTPVVKLEEPDEADVKMEDTEECLTSLALRYREGTSPTTPQPRAILTPIVYAYKLLLLLMHGTDLRLVEDHTQPFEDTIIAVDKLIRLCCKLYDCAYLLRPSVANYLHQYRKELFLAIKDDPPKFAVLATYLRDDSILTEAYVHLVGAYNENHWPWKTPKQKLNKHFLERVKLKAEKLATDCVLISLRLFQNSIHVEDGGGDASATRVSIQSAKDSWTAISLFRDWLAAALDNAADDASEKGAVFRTLRKGGDEYMPIWQVYKNMQELGVGFDHEELGNDVKILKDFAKETVRELCGNTLMLDVEGNGIRYLTCAEVGPEDMPWYGLDGEMVDDD
ncbi:hypothetical protein EG328_011463 [Venturia inaequalis]|uniref:Uncharacterized protein n=1 Tax=Venturia inaequalis TaxID=5025 RepID=A0A8H3U4M4_VENIN|nr:hypothetical protein EG328_011463 [Venturia inaequalis]